jgi:hypothetical protein
MQLLRASRLSQLKVHIMSRNIATTLVLAGPGISLAGCGYSPGDCVAAGDNPLAGASIGGDIGAIGGAVIKSNDVDLGRPF